MSGAVKYCRFGNCRSDSRPQRPGFDPATKFFRFPKPCFSFRKSGHSNYRRRASSDPPHGFIKNHIRNCRECTVCQEWVLRCKREDRMFRSIADVTKDSYICSKHFDPNITEVDYNIHLPGVTVKKRRKLNRDPAVILSNLDAQTSMQEVTTFADTSSGAAIAAFPANQSSSDGNSLDLPVTPWAPVINVDDVTLTPLAIHDGPLEETMLHSSGTAEMEGPLDTVASSDLILDGTITKSSESIVFVDSSTVFNRSMQCQTEFVYRSVETQTSFECVSVGIQTDVTHFDIVLDENQRLQDENQRLKQEIRLENESSSVLREKLKKRRPIDTFEKTVKNHDDISTFYLGFTYVKLIMILEFLDITNLSNYWNTNYTAKNKKMFTPIQEFIITLLKLRGGLLVQDIAYRFDVSLGYVSQTCTTWIQALYCKFDALRPHMFPSREKIQEHLPERFSSLKNIRVIIDGAEIFTETPQNFEFQSNTYSNYKAHPTFKILLGCTPNGAISFVSDVFEGSISDRELVKQSKLLDLLDEGDLVLADRGFTIKDLTDIKNIELNIPAFLRGRDKLTPQEEVATRNIAKLRIFVENMVRRLKEFRLFKRVLPLSMRNTLSQCVFICACLVNFNPPLINDAEER